MSAVPITVTSVTTPTSTEPFVRAPGMLERIVAIGMLFVFAFALPIDWFVRVGGSSAGTVQGGSPLTTLTFLSFLGVVWLAFNGNWHLLTAAAAREPLLTALIGLAGISVLWSVNLVETLSTAVVMTITLLVGFYFAVRYRIGEVISMASIAMAVGVVSNYVFIFVFQDFGLDTINVGTDGGAKWSGVFVTKNELGRIASLSAMIFAFNAVQRRSFFIWPLWTLLALIQVLASDSATSLGATGGVIALTAVFLGFRGRKTLYGATAVAMVSIFSALTILAATNLAAATGLLGKDSTFTGRLPLWQNSFEFGIAERPWLGYGWIGFWTDEVSRFEVVVRSNFAVPHAHNAFIDAWLFIGPIGAILLAAIYGRGLIWGARNIRAVSGAAGLFPILMISYGFIFSLTEVGVIRRDISLVLFVVAIVQAASNKGEKVPYMVRKDLEEAPI